MILEFSFMALSNVSEIKVSSLVLRKMEKIYLYILIFLYFYIKKKMWS